LIPIRKVLIANRGEIARRIARTCHARGIATVAVYSEADRAALHVREAQEAVLLGPAPSRESYLRVDRILEAARRTGADAVHPGYGFLSENAEFAEAVVGAGLRFIGPPPEAIRRMGLKSVARAIAAEAQVPTVPGYNGEDQGRLRAEALRLGFPVLIKASAGGGGKGMRLVRAEGELDEALAGARREAAAAFGNGDLLLEKYIERARHVEIQILGDAHGNLIHFGERECSIQRRHQKIIEEAPSPAVDEHLRARLGEAAVSIGRALGYASAGTVEFLLAPSGEFFFIEVNTRIQVEHPVTEMVCGVDLVDLQLSVAEGRPLGIRQEEVRLSGHAIEARLYAEDPANDYLPATGTVLRARFGDARIETGIETGSEISIYYDPMVAKLIAAAPARAEAIRRLSRALEDTLVLGVTTNRDFLLRVLADPGFQAGDTHTGFLEGLPPAATDPERDVTACCLLAAYLDMEAFCNRKHLPRIPKNFRNNPYRDPFHEFACGGVRRKVSWRNLAGPGHRFAMQCGQAVRDVAILSWTPESMRAEVDGLQAGVEVARAGDRYWIESPLASAALTRLPRYPEPAAAAEHETANAPMPGLVLRIPVAPGEEVQPGQALVVLEAMKMEQTIRAGVHGRVEAVLVRVGEIVAPGQRLVEIGALEK
jgi:acetyl-CoA carboxylase biotin carboxylase subunit